MELLSSSMSFRIGMLNLALALLVPNVLASQVEENKFGQAYDCYDCDTLYRIELFKNAILEFEQKPNFLDFENYYYSFLNIGTLYEGIGKTEEALDAYSQAIIADSELYHGYLRRGNLYFEIGQFHKAEEDYTSYINQIDGFLSDTLPQTSTQVHALYSESNIGRLIRDFHKNRGLVRISLGKINESCDDFDKACAQGAQDACQYSRDYCN